MKLDSKIYVAGHRGMVGSAVVRQLKSLGYNNIITRTHNELDLTNQSEVDKFFTSALPNVVVMCAAKVGGIKANNDYPADFIFSNLTIASNIIHAAYKNNVNRFLFLGSSCIYPKHADQPIKEEYLLTSALEPTNEAYAIAKIAGLKMCQYYRKQFGVMFHSLMPTNLYGIGDNYHSENSHVLPALIRRFHEAKINNSPTVTAWGTGSASREFLYADDLASAIITSLQLENPPDWMNVGYGTDVTIKELTEIVARVIEYKGTIIWDKTKPDGTPRKLLDSSEIFKTGWKPKINLEEGIKLAYNDFIQERYERNY